ncbi:MAG: HlyD family efflux transporter periplasmic adaptor subunit [Chitinophagaceae bacterium]|nr:HlyD family efflux transporter periplasmic adaptor subunit [Chitinophagaceae bacterium]
MNTKKMYVTFLLALAACSGEPVYDASGTFETDEVIISAEQTGKILSLPIREGDSLGAGQKIGSIDVSNLVLQKEQKQASVEALREKTTDVQPQLELVRKQLAVQNSQMDQLLREKARTSNLLKADAATQKQLDDINSVIDQLQKQMAVTRQQIQLYQSNFSTQNRSILSEQVPAQKTVAIVEDQIKKGIIINPVSGVILTQYSFEGEYATIGKPLYKIADLSWLTLRAYITGNQLPAVKLSQPVKVLVDDGKKGYKEYPGTICWISNKAEFTPKTIQTKDERANLVYAIKIRVKNDGYLKIGMYSEVKL